jgi:hypothetical protein
MFGICCKRAKTSYSPYAVPPHGLRVDRAEREGFMRVVRVEREGFMRSRTIGILLVASVIALSPSATAAAITFGPFPDFKGIGPVPGPVVIPTLLPLTLIPIPGDGFLPILLRDRITINFRRTPIPFIALTYATFSVVGVTVGPLIGFTDIWALDQNPNGSTFNGTGFDPADPQIVPASNEEFIGLSGTSYPATTRTTSTISQLPSLLQGFDLSALSGNPNSLVYVFQADVPLADAVTPEPTTAVTVATAIVALLLSRHRMSKLRFMRLGLRL